MAFPNASTIDFLLDQPLADRDLQAALTRNGRVDETKWALALNVEMNDDLVTEAAIGRANCRNNYGPKVLFSGSSKLLISVRYQRLANSDLQLIDKYRRQPLDERRCRLTSEKIGSTHTRSTAVGKIEGHWPSSTTLTKVKG